MSRKACHCSICRTKNRNPRIADTSARNPTRARCSISALLLETLQPGPSVRTMSARLLSASLTNTHSLLRMPRVSCCLRLSHWSAISFSAWHLHSSLRLIRGGEQWVGALQICSHGFVNRSLSSAEFSISQRLSHTHLHPPMSSTSWFHSERLGTDGSLLSDRLKKFSSCALNFG